MSVINQMLKDLDKRQQHNSQAVSPLVDDSGRSLRAYLLIAFALLVLAFSAWLALRYFANFESDSSVEVINESANNRVDVVVQAPQQEPVKALQAMAQAIDVELSPATSSQNGELPEPSQAQSVQPSPAESLPKAKLSNSTEQANSQIAKELASEAEVEEVTSAEVTLTSPALAKTQASTSAAKPSADSTKGKPETVNQSIAEGELQIKPLELSLEQRVAMYKRRGFQALERNQPSQARVEFAKALQLEHSAHEVREQLAALVYASGDLPRAVALLEEGLQLQPQRSSFRLMLAKIFVQQQQLVQALAYLEGASPEIAGHVDYYAMQAGLAQRLDRQQLALLSYQELLRYQPSQARWWLGYAIANDKLANYAEALSAYRQAQLVGQLSVNSSEFVASRITQLEQ